MVIQAQFSKGRKIDLEKQGPLNSEKITAAGVGAENKLRGPKWGINWKTKEHEGRQGGMEGNSLRG